MRESTDGPTRDHVSNPLWWILGIIAIILVTSAIRRSSTSHRMPRDLHEFATTTGIVMVAEIQLSRSEDQSDAILPFLQRTLTQKGFDTSIHRSADGAYSNGSFQRQTDQERVYQAVEYLRSSALEGSNETHRIQFSVSRIGVSDENVAIQDTQEFADEVHQQLVEQFPDCVANYDKTIERNAPYDMYE